MPARSGSRTPWQEWDGELGPDGLIVLVRDGTTVGDTSLLAEAIRADGITRGLYDAYRLIDNAVYTHAFYGYVEGGWIRVVCDAGGITKVGDIIDSPTPCVFVSLGIT